MLPLYQNKSKTKSNHIEMLTKARSIIAQFSPFFTIGAYSLSIGICGGYFLNEVKWRKRVEEYKKELNDIITDD